ncbi:hypothetical protein BN1708_017619, partial [Verticillium longisporum]
QGW